MDRRRTHYCTWSSLVFSSRLLTYNIAFFRSALPWTQESRGHPRHPIEAVRLRYEKFSLGLFVLFPTPTQFRVDSGPSVTAVLCMGCHFIYNNGGRGRFSWQRVGIRSPKAVWAGPRTSKFDTFSPAAGGRQSTPFQLVSLGWTPMIVAATSHWKAPAVLRNHCWVVGREGGRGRRSFSLAAHRRCEGSTVDFSSRNISI